MRIFVRAADAVSVPVHLMQFIIQMIMQMKFWDARLQSIQKQLYISLIVDVSPNCDCHSENDAAILPNIGMFASFDPVALDQACADACLKADPMPNSQLSDNLAKPDWHHHHDHFMDSNPNVRWKETLEHAEKIGLGTREYELIYMK